MLVRPRQSSVRIKQNATFYTKRFPKVLNEFPSHCSAVKYRKCLFKRSLLSVIVLWDLSQSVIYIHTPYKVKMGIEHHI